MKLEENHTMEADPCPSPAPCPGAVAQPGVVLDSCECMPFDSVYAAHYAECGDAFEFTPSTAKGVPFNLAKKILDQGFCKEFFQKMEMSDCVNVAFDNTPGKWYSGQTW